MAVRKKSPTGNKVRTNPVRSRSGSPKCVALADRGINTGQEFAQMMSLLIGDIATNRIDARAANAICNAGGKLLKVVEMQHKYGRPTPKEKCGATLLLTK